jgi:glutamate--cysteine ligase
MKALNRMALIEGYHAYGKADINWRVGAEFERIAVHSTGRQLDYSEPGGIREIMEVLADQHNWEPSFEGPHLIAMSRKGSHLTLEPGGQLELATQPYQSLARLAQEVEDNFSELQSATRLPGVRWIASGLSPFSAPEDVEWVPKGRYQIMRDYLPERGPLAPVMMKSTSSFQMALDYRDEADCARKTNTLLRLGPLTTALFANSPIRLGRDTGLASARAAAWMQTDPARTGFPPTLMAGYSHERWVDYLLDTPMMFFMHDGQWLPASGKTFRDYMDSGHDGVFPDWSDWELHQTSVFPEVRVKHFIELRGADACPIPLAMAGIAMWTGALYNESALTQAHELAQEFADAQPAATAFDGATRTGLEYTVGEGSLAKWGERLLDIAKSGLTVWQPEALPLLAPLDEMIQNGRSPASRHRAAFESRATVADYLDALRY